MRWVLWKEILTWTVADVYFHISNNLGSPPMLDCRKIFCFLTFRKRCKWPYPNVFALLSNMYPLLLFFKIWSFKDLRWLCESILFKRGTLFCKSMYPFKIFSRLSFWFRVKVSQPPGSLIMCNFQCYMLQTNAVQSEWERSWRKIL